MRFIKYEERGQEQNETKVYLNKNSTRTTGTPSKLGLRRILSVHFRASLHSSPMSVKRFPFFTALNVITILAFSAALVFAVVRWKGFLKDCPSSSIIVDAVYGVCGFMIGLGVMGILATITRSKLMIYVFKFFLFLAFVAACAFVALALMMKSGVADFVLQFGWSRTPDAALCDFQKQFGCAGWSSVCIPEVSIDGCPSCTFPLNSSHTNASSFYTGSSFAPTHALMRTCKALFQSFFDDQFIWIMIGSGSFAFWVLVLNVAAYCAGQQFTLVSIDDDEEYLLKRAERRRDLERVLSQEPTMERGLHTPVNSNAFSSSSMQHMGRPPHN